MVGYFEEGNGNSSSVRYYVFLYKLVKQGLSLWNKLIRMKPYKNFLKIHSLHNKNMQYLCY